MLGGGHLCCVWGFLSMAFGSAGNQHLLIYHYLACLLTRCELLIPKVILIDKTRHGDLR
jgi:hypothetical protein